MPLDLAAAGLELLVVDTGTSHTHADGGYGDRRRECEEAAARLGVPALRDIARRRGLAGLDDDVLLRRARHIVTENARVLEVVRVLRGTADPRAIGPVLTEGHASLRDDFQISTPSSTPASTRRWRPARTAPAWSAAVSAAARSSWSTATGPTRSPTRSASGSPGGARPRRARSTWFRRRALAAAGLRVTPSRAR